jgi:hypothetical protein
MNEITARILKYYKTLRENKLNSQQEPITINNYIFPDTNGNDKIKEYSGVLHVKERHRRIRHRYKLKYGV